MNTRFFGGLGLLLVLSLFLTQTTFAYGFYGPQTYSDADKYLYFGSDSESKTERNGISLGVDPASVSFQTVKANLTLDLGLIEERSIVGVYIMANYVVVDEVEMYFDTALQEWKRNYYIDIDVETSKIGSDVYFQAVAITEQGTVDPLDQFVVGWSSVTETFTLKPLPVIDREAIGVLQAIYAKLEELLAALTSSMAALQKAVEDIYTPSPEAQAKLDTAIDNFMDKLPMTELAEKVDELNQTLENSKAQLSNPDTSSLQLGGTFRLIPELAESEVYFLDLTEYREQVKLFRDIMSASFWVYFFYMLLKMITPTPQI